MSENSRFFRFLSAALLVFVAPSAHAAPAASCLGRIYQTGDDPFDPSSIPVVEFDCAYLDGYLYQRVPLP